MNKDFKNRVNNKIRSNSGESLTETLVALLIAALAVAMLAGAVAAASHMVLSTRDKLDKYYDANDKIVQMSNGGTDAIVKIVDKSGETSSTVAKSDVLYYRNDVFEKNPVVAYKIK